MARKYTKVEQLTEIVKERHDQGETYGEIATSLGLKKKPAKKGANAGRWIHSAPQGAPTQGAS